MMRRFACALLLALAATPAVAQPTTSPTGAGGRVQVVNPTVTVAATTPVATAGAALNLTGNAGWPTKVDYLYDSPSAADATGKVIVHWFCTTKPKATGQSCADELARMVTLKESNPRVYIIAYINGGKSDAKKLDPIRESEGVGRGTVAYGKNITSWFKKQKIVSPTSVVVDVDGKVAHITTGAVPAELDARDAKVAELAGRIKEYSFSSDGPKTVKVGEKFALSISVKLAPWLTYSAKTTTELKVTVPKDIKCDNTVLKGDQLKPAGDTLTAAVTCSGPRGNYEARAQLTFGYEGPSGTATGLGAESANWKFEIKP